MIYLDHNATSPATTAHYQELFSKLAESAGNPSSPHAMGRNASVALTKARRFVASALGVDVAQLIFVSGATEANNMATKGVLRRHGVSNCHAITSAIEHPAILEPLQLLERLEGLTLTLISPDEKGFVAAKEIVQKINENTKLVTLMAANNEVGSCQPVQLLGDFFHYYRWGIQPGKNLEQVLELEASLSPLVTKEILQKCHFHVDAVQALGKIPTEKWMSPGIDSCSVSGHKLGSLQGVGALFLRRGRQFSPLVLGGAQEKNRRAGTENLAGIISFGMVCEKTLDEKYWTKVTEMDKLRVQLFKALQNFSQVQMNSNIENSLPNTVNFSVASRPSQKNGEDILLELDMKGVCASSGSACSSGANLPSKILMAMGKGENLSKNAIRLSLSTETTDDQICKTIEIFREILG